MSDYAHIEQELINLADTYDRLSVEYMEAVKDSVNKRHELDMERSRQTMKADPKLTVDRRKAFVDGICDAVEFEAHLAEGIVEALKMRMRSIDAQLNACQTRAGFLKAEMRQWRGAA